MSSLREEIEILKKEKQAVILAHYYVPDEVQEIADYTGDSFYLSKVARRRMQRFLFLQEFLLWRKCQDFKSGEKSAASGSDGRLCHGAYGRCGKNQSDEGE